MLLELRHNTALLQLVDLDDGVQELEVVPRVAGEKLEKRDVLGEARAAKTDPRPEVRLADPAVEAHAARDLLDVRAHELADVGDLVDEADPRAEKRVRGE